MSESIKDKILKSLIETKKLREQDIDEVLIHQRRMGVSFGKAIIDKGIIQEKDLLIFLVRELNVPFINLKKYKLDPSLREIIPENFARQYNIIPISFLDKAITVALSDPLNVFVVDDLKNITGKEIDVVMSTMTDIQSALDRFYGEASSSTVSEITRDIQVEDFEIVTESTEDGDIDGALDENEAAPIIRMVNLVIKDAIRQRSSDIHLEPMVDCLRVRYRIDGVLKDVLNIPKKNQNSVLVRIKILSRLDITVNQAPQDGRFKLKISGKEVDFRVSLLPTIFGQKVVMRILDKQSLVGLNGLGLDDRSLKIMQDAVVKPFGMILITGPTGSGKSTTLYSILQEVNTVDKNIITIEDPVEYLMDGMTQIQAQPDIGLTFAEGLRSVLRQSPDIVMVGEIRDNETADIAIKAALTGQLVFSTLHTNDAPGALTRLVDMGVEPFLVSSSVVLITAQRLCRKICQRCKEEINIPARVFDELQYDFKTKVVFHQGKGCQACHNTGYMGRMCITEILEVSDEVKDMLLKRESSDAIKEYARTNQGMATLWEDAMEKCVAGLTTLEEVLRVTSAD